MGCALSSAADLAGEGPAAGWVALSLGQQAWRGEVWVACEVQGGCSGLLQGGMRGGWACEQGVPIRWQR